MTRDTAGKGKLFEEPFHAGFVLGDVWIEFAVSAFEVGVCDDSGSAVTGTGDEDHVEVMHFDEAVQVDVDEVQSGRGTPVAEEARFDVFEFERLFEERIVVEIDLADGEVVGGAPVGVHFGEEGG